MKQLYLISIFCFIQYGHAFYFSPQELKDSFKINPELYRLGIFYSNPRIDSLDSNCKLETYTSSQNNFELKYSRLSRNNSPIAYAMEITPNKYNDFVKPFLNWKTIDTLGTLIDRDYRQYVQLNEFPMDYAYILSPFSGLDFGAYGGYRYIGPCDINLYFFNYRDSVPAKDFHLLLCALNPYVRIMAVNYYYQHKRKFKTHKKQLLPIIKQVMNENETLIYHSGGCINSEFTAKSVFKRYRWKKLFQGTVFPFYDPEY